MTSLLLDWAGLLIRWAHMLAGIMWIGTSFYFIWLDASLRKRKSDDAIAGESWMVHGGGFYQVEKFVVAPERLPEELHWFKYEAYFTWLTGFVLMAIIYYWGAEAFLINPAVMELSVREAVGISIATLVGGWVVYDVVCRLPLGGKPGILALCVFALVAAACIAYPLLFSGRAAFIHIGSFIGTIMAANVLFIIIPNQKKTVAALLQGEAPDPDWGEQAKQRSLHNNYLTLPVLFMMISNHYPIVFGHELSWLVALGIVVAGGLIRHFFNQHDAGRLTKSGRLALPAAALAILALIVVTTQRAGISGSGETVAFTDVRRIVTQHCSPCHATIPTNDAFEEAPGGVIFDTGADIVRYADKILAQAVLTDTMPLGNLTAMTKEERELLGAWVAQGANIE